MGAAVATAAAVAAGAIALVLSSGSSTQPVLRAAARARFTGALEECSTRSEADLPGGFAAGSSSAGESWWSSHGAAPVAIS
jgi:hypothetical protein